MRRLLFLLSSTLFILPQSSVRAQGQATPRTREGTAAPEVNVAYIRENYSKYEYKIAMRDGVKLFTAVYIPKDAMEGKKYPILMVRTPYNVAPYGEDQFPASLGTVSLICPREVHFRLPGRTWEIHE